MLHHNAVLISENFRNLENDLVANLLNLNSIQRAYHTERFQISLLN